MDEVVPHLWIGELPSCLEADYLEQANIQWVVSCLRNPPVPPKGISLAESDSTREIPDDHRMVVPINDDDDAPAYIYFALANKFIANALQEEWEADPEPYEEVDDHAIDGLTLRDGRPGLWSSRTEGSVLVHCQAGCSRSVTIVAAYLMWSRRLSVAQALALIRRQRPIAAPNEGFMKQLELYQRENYMVNLQSRDVRRFLVSQTNALEGAVSPDMLLSTYPYTAPTDPYSDYRIDLNEAKQERITKLRCKVCRHELAVEQHVVVHEPGQGEQAFEPHRRDAARKGVGHTPARMQEPEHTHLPPQLARIRAGMMAQTTQRPLLLSPQCSAYFVEPLGWMSESSGLVEGEMGGRLQCPNTRCNAKLGTWTWVGSQCACGAWVTPAFALQRAKVDQV